MHSLLACSSLTSLSHTHPLSLIHTPTPSLIHSLTHPPLSLSLSYSLGCPVLGKLRDSLLCWIRRLQKINEYRARPGGVEPSRWCGLDDRMVPYRSSWNAGGKTIIYCTHNPSYSTITTDYSWMSHLCVFQNCAIMRYSPVIACIVDADLAFSFECNIIRIKKLHTHTHIPAYLA